MRIRLAVIAAAALAAGMSGEAVAQYVCPPGYAYYGGVCQPVARSYSNPCQARCPERRLARPLVITRQAQSELLLAARLAPRPAPLPVPLVW